MHWAKSKTKAMSLLEMMIVLAVITFFVLGIASPFLVGTKDQAMAVIAQNMESDLNNHYHNWLAAGGVLEGRPKTSDLLMLFTSGAGTNKTITSSDDPSAKVKDGGYSNLMRLNLPETLKPAADLASTDTVSDKDYSITYNNDTGKFAVTSLGGGGTPTTGGGTDPGTGPGPDPGGGVDPGTGPGPGGGGPTHVPQPHEQSGTFYAFTWSNSTFSSQYLHTMYRIPSYTPEQDAANAKAGKQDGQIAIFFQGSPWTSGLSGLPEDNIKNPDGTLTSYKGPWMEQGIINVRDGTDQASTNPAHWGTDEWFRRYVNAGGKADYVVLDWEYFYDFWYGSVEPFMTFTKITALYADPRANTIPQAPSLALLDPAVSSASATQAKIAFTISMMDIINGNTRAAFLDPARKYLPNARTSNYMTYIMSASNNVPFYNGSTYMNFRTKAGTDNAPSLYASIGDLKDVELVPGVKFGNSDYARVLWQVNFQRGVQRSSSAPVTPWMSYRSFADGNSPLSSAYYREFVLHLMLSGARTIFLWNPSGLKGSGDDEDFATPVGDFNARVGTGWRYPLSLQGIPWSSTLIVSGMKLENGKTVYRVTGAPGVVSATASNGDIVNFDSSGVGGWYESASGDQVTFTPNN